MLLAIKNDLTTVKQFTDMKDCPLRRNAIKAWHYAGGYTDEDLDNYVVIRVEGYYCVAKLVDNFAPFEISDDIFPFDEERTYPMQGVELTLCFKRY